MPEEKTVNMKKRFGVAIFIILLLSFILYLILFQLPIFKLENIDVVGNKYLTSSDIVSLSGLTKGISIFKVNKSNVVNLIKKNPYIKEVNVSVVYPSKVVVKIDERKIVAQIYNNNKYIFVDTEGVAVDTGGYNKNLPIINGLNLTKYEIGKKINEIYENNDMAKLLMLIYNKNMYKSIVVNKENIILETKTGINIVLDNVDNLDYSLKFSELILKDLEKKGYYSGKVQIERNGNPIYTP
ncbi:FtsQ-type POTRA domain-containing protein [Thermoanaerobacterium sp. RBIITD]|uniref:cell division protein FtsQ/DivIB n=1 Tax=Thermoanaerobacterium sp. RBIITD TaxID=1550240 RepID=UPI000BB79848|nr:FtsQ-type POTRA domain-containing protein [Thermoanaerobacterium sp. RBIITD]SNX52786.1 cell division protein FtsQ [Thermoanaerobacterium sp. RBIITD]